MGVHVATLSTKGQLVVPKELRDQLKWPPGTRVVFERSGNGVMIRMEPQYRRTRMDEVFGMLKYDGPPKTIEEMDAGLQEAVAEDYRRSIAGD